MYIVAAVYQKIFCAIVFFLADSAVNFDCPLRTFRGRVPTVVYRLLAFLIVAVVMMAGSL